MDKTSSKPTSTATKQRRSTTSIIAISFMVLSVLLAAAVAYLSQQNSSLAAKNNQTQTADTAFKRNKTAPPANPRAVIQGTVSYPSEALPPHYAVCAFSGDTLLPYCTTKFTAVPDKGASIVTYELGAAPGRYTVMGIDTGDDASTHANVSVYNQWHKDGMPDVCLDPSSATPLVVVATVVQPQRGVDVGSNAEPYNCQFKDR